MGDVLKHPGPNPQPYRYENEVYTKGLLNQKSQFTFQTDQWEGEAKKVLSGNAWGFLHGSAGTGETTRKNTGAFQKWSIVGNRMIDGEWPDMSVEVFGQKLPYPIAIAPVGVQKIFTPEGEPATARACYEESVPYIMSTASATSLEKAAAANKDGVRWYQMYWPSDNEITVSLLARAKQSGFSALFVTVDTPTGGWRPHDLDNGYIPFLTPDEIGVEIGFSDPVFQRKHKEKTGKTIQDDMGLAAAEWAQIVSPGWSRGWKDLAWLRQQWDGPIVLKGILSPADAKRAAEAGMNGVVVSNHGGRQQDGGVGTLTMLPKVVEALKGTSCEVFFDSGVRCGADIFKALALGAKMVLIGRPFVYGLAFGGQAGVQHVIKALLGELDLTMHIGGVKSTSREDLNEDLLIRE